MYDIAKALVYLDGDMLADAMQTIGAGERTAEVGFRAVRRKSPRLRRGAAAKAIAVSVGALAVFLPLAVWAAVVFTGNEATDIYRVGDEMAIESFESIRAIYPDAEMAERLGGTEWAEAEISLYYTEGESWQDSENWYSLIFGAGVRLEDGTLQTVTLMCLFTGTLEDWEVGMADYAGRAEIGDTEVRLAYNPTVDCRYALFEKNGIVYDLRMQFASPSESDFAAILGQLLK